MKPQPAKTWFDALGRRDRSRGSMRDRRGWPLWAIAAYVRGYFVQGGV